MNRTDVRVCACAVLSEGDVCRGTTLMFGLENCTGWEFDVTCGTGD